MLAATDVDTATDNFIEIFGRHIASTTRERTVTELKLKNRG